jgi:HTH-type transcriptional regulator/antitoxin HipB
MQPVMIKNEKQYKITKSKLALLQEGIAGIKSENPIGVKSRLVLNSMLDMSTSMEAQISAYDALKENKTISLKSRSLQDLPAMIIEYRIASGLTQKEMAKKIGMKEQQLQRYENRDFESVSFQNMLEILRAIGLKLVISVTPVGKNDPSVSL